MKRDRVTARAMEGLSQTDTLSDSKVEVRDQQLEDTPQMTLAEMSGHYHNVIKSANTVR
jgi:hypothetical protein